MTMAKAKEIQSAIHDAGIISAVGYHWRSYETSDRVKEARERAKTAGVEDRVEIIEGNLFDVDLRDATVVTLYLLPSLNLRLRPKLQKLRPGTRILSHDFDMGDWKPDRVREVLGKTVYFWTVPRR